jgi:hypothetical protein
MGVCTDVAPRGQVHTHLPFRLLSWHSQLQPLQAKRLAKDLNAQVAAAEAAAAADLLLARSPAGSAALRAMATRLEAAAAAITPPATAPSAVGMGVTQAPASSTSNSAVCGAAAFQELLAPRVAACKRRCEVERAAEELHRAAAACRTLADLPKLEAAILTARKVRKGSTETWIVACFLWSGAC